jgi:GTP pyrophosphokinase
MSDYGKEMAYLKGYLQGKGFTQALLALSLAKKMHEGQTRKTGESYIIHPVRVCTYLNALGIDDDDTLAVALLHDVAEDTNTNLRDLKGRGFNDIVIGNVELLTKRKMQSASEYYEKIKEGTTFNNAVAALVKLSDRCNNVSTMAGAFDRKKIIEYVQETETYIYDLCKRLKDVCPKYSNQVFVMRYNLESMLRAYILFLENTK